MTIKQSFVWKKNNNNKKTKTTTNKQAKHFFLKGERNKHQQQQQQNTHQFLLLLKHCQNGRCARFGRLHVNLLNRRGISLQRKQKQKKKEEEEKKQKKKKKSWKMHGNGTYYMWKMDSVPTPCQEVEPLQHNLPYETSQHQKVVPDFRHWGPCPTMPAQYL